MVIIEKQPDSLKPQTADLKRREAPCLKPPTSHLKPRSERPFASLSLDLDNQWSYMKIHGDAGWETFPSYFNIFIPHVLDVLDRWNLKITFFIVGQDAALEKNQDYLKEITTRGHEVGNHSFHHESWLHKYDRNKVMNEVMNAEDHILRSTGEKPTGFRGPGFSWSPTLLDVLAECGYLFDASTLPTYIGPLARMYYFWKSDLSPKEREDRDELFGGIANGFQSVKPYRWQLNGQKSILEIPVTTIPGVKTPFHLSYLLYLSRFSGILMKSYLSIAIGSCRLSGTSPSFLLHPLDLIGGDKLTDLSFFPGMDLDSDRKLQVFNTVISTLLKHFDIVPMSEHAKHLLNQNNLKVVKAR
ncbi:Polysaccharide deacetylase [Olavius algarvensis associated proteobacterium Delta 3]|nr:Polysaccharide deacetylase [Olavius algarvensis associated proteobacterium Delta 3]CAB5122739.1 Polysaccharide deacetylase [Olavius algarvensis associated proteobacterium Delta 3]